MSRYNKEVAIEKGAKLSAPSLTQRFARGVSWNVVLALANQGSSFVVSILLASELGRRTFGQFAVVQSTLVTISGIAQVATGITAAKFVAQNRVNQKEAAADIIRLCQSFTFFTGLVGGCTLILASRELSHTTLGAPELSSGFVVAAGAAVFLTMNASQLGALAGLEAFRASGTSALLTGVSHVLLCVAGARRFGLQGAFLGLLASSLLRWAIFRYVLRRAARQHGIVIGRAKSGTQRTVIMTFALPAALCGISSMISMWLGNVLLARQAHGFDLVALYAAAFQLRLAVILLPMLFNGVGISLLNFHQGLRDELGYRRAYWVNVKIGVATTLIGAIIMALLGRPLLNLYGKGFEGAFPILNILLVSAALEGAAASVFQSLMSRGRMWLALFSIVLPRDCLFVVAAFGLIPIYGGIGLALASSIAWLLGSMLTLFVSRKVGLTLGYDACPKTGR